MTTAIRSLLLAASLVAALPPLARADGELDPSFAASGIAVADLGDDDDRVVAAALAPGGRIVLAGDLPGATDRDLVVAAFTSTGAPDVAFATTGRITADFGGVEQANGVAVDQDGSIVVAGTRLKDGEYQLVLALYRPDGALDTSFNGSGRRVLSFSDAADNLGGGVAFDLDGRIVVAGTRTTANGSAFAVARLLRNGELDTSFNGTGKRFVDFGLSNGVNATGTAVALADDGKVVVAGTRVGASGTDFAIARIDRDGALDATFNGSGKVSVDFGGTDEAHAITLRPDGAIAVAGERTTASGSDFAVTVRLNDGSADVAFKGNGKATTDFGGDEMAFAIAAQADGKLVAVGVRSSANGKDFAVARYLADGTSDPALDGDGKLRVDLATGSDDVATGIAVQPDGRLVVAGTSTSGGKDDAAIVRLLSPLTTPAGVLEIPSPGSWQSGVGLISGWLCNVPSVEVRIDGRAAAPTAYGTTRADTTGICGDANNGFGLLFNWALLGDGTHVVRAFTGGKQFASARFRVTTFGEPFLRGASGTYTLPGFPQADGSVDVTWTEGLQRFVVTKHTKGTAGATSAASTASTARATNDTTAAFLENPTGGSVQSGIGVISGWICNASNVFVRIDNRTPVRAAYGTSRADTQGACGDSNNGFGLLFNWGLLSAGNHAIEVRADGAIVASTTFSVTTLGTPFLRGASASYTLPDFPSPGRSVDVAWDEGQQGFVVVAAD
ncbi:MAG: hypothetical protein FJ148_24385 [Deltaproteobacteria bacterium]|nr:hypothetical protein [Deltaproteobacteria bacterium]